MRPKESENSVKFSSASLPSFFVIAAVVFFGWRATAETESNDIRFCKSQLASCWLVTDAKSQNLKERWGDGDFQIQLFPKSVLEFNSQSEPVLHDGRVWIRSLSQDPQNRPLFEGLNFKLNLPATANLFVESLGGFEFVGNLAGTPLKVSTKDGRILQIPPFMQVRVGPITSEKKNLLDIPQVLKIANLQKQFHGVLTEEDSSIALDRLAGVRPEDVGGDFNRQIASYAISEKERQAQVELQRRKDSLRDEKTRRQHYFKKVFEQ